VSGTWFVLAFLGMTFLTGFTSGCPIVSLLMIDVQKNMMQGTLERAMAGIAPTVSKL
jgi:hypothetical protein